MKKKKISVFLKSLSVFMGTIIGVGMFGLPFVASKAGFSVVFIYFVLMVSIAIIVHFFFAEVALGTNNIYRLPGYVGEYLGIAWKKASFIVIATGIFGALLAYLIVAGKFLNSLLGPYIGGSAFIYTIIFFLLGTYLVFRGIKGISGTEMILLIIILLIVLLFLIKSFPFINFYNFQIVNLKYLFFPFGVVLFSLWGTELVPEIKEMLARSIKNKNELKINLKIVLASGLIFSAIIYLVFVFIVLGASGANTSEEAISGLGKILGSNSLIIKLGFIFGIIACFTSFLTLALTLKKIFWYDFGLSKNLSWFLTCFFPLALFLLGMQKFIEVIGLTGAFAVGGEGIIIIFLYRKFLKEKTNRRMNIFYYLLVFVFVLGIISEIAYLFQI